MAFKVRATVVDMLGDTENYPCHFEYKIGEEIIFDGEKFIGRICPALFDTNLIQNIRDLYLLGPRHKNPWWVHPMWYCPRSVADSSRKKYDGLGYRGVLENRSESRYHMANLLPKEAWIWPPHPERNVAKEVTVMCPDVRTAVILHLEAVDLVDSGYDIIFFRRNMSILGKILQTDGVRIDKIMDLFSSDEIEIYPTLSQMIIPPFVEELELMGYVDVRDEIVSGTEKGQAKLDDFVETLSKEEREALHL